MNQQLPYQTQGFSEEQLSKISISLSTLAELSGRTVDFKMDHKTYRIGSLRSTTQNKITFGIWQCEDGGLSPVGRAQVESNSSHDLGTEMKTAFYVAIRDFNLMYFSGVNNLKKVSGSYAFGIDYNYRGIGLGQFLFAVLLHCLKLNGIDSLSIFSDRTVNTKDTSFIYNTEHDIILMRNPRSFYSQYSNVCSMITDGKWNTEEDYWIISTSITAMQQSLIVNILRNSA